jgi:hypothetical protein
MLVIAVPLRIIQGLWLCRSELPKGYGSAVASYLGAMAVP